MPLSGWSSLVRHMTRRQRRRGMPAVCIEQICRWAAGCTKLQAEMSNTVRDGVLAPSGKPATPSTLPKARAKKRPGLPPDEMMSDPPLTRLTVARKLRNLCLITASPQANPACVSRAAALCAPPASLSNVNQTCPKLLLSACWSKHRHSVTKGENLERGGHPWCVDLEVFRKR